MVKFRILVVDFCHGFIDSIAGFAFIRRLLEEESKEIKYEPPAPREKTVLELRREKQGIFRRPPEPPKKKDSFVKKLLQIYATNIGLLLLWQIVFFILSFIFQSYPTWGEILSNVFTIIPYIASRIIQALWFSDINGACLRALNLPPAKSMGFSVTIGESITSIIHGVIFLVQGILSQYLPIPLITPFIVFVHMALMNSMYCFDYFFEDRNLPFLRRREYFESHWPYFLGFGSPLALACSFSSNMFVNGCIFALLFPLFIISSYPANWNRSYEENIPKIAFCQISYMLTQHVARLVKSWTPTNRMQMPRGAPPQNQRVHAQ